MDNNMHTEPIMDIVSPPKDPMTTEPIQPAETKPQAQVTEPIEKQSVSKQANQNLGVGVAIFATVIIVIALSLLATYAYIKTR